MDETQKYTVYGLIFPNDKIYIGQTGNFNKRMSQYKRISSAGRLVSKAIKKYGWENVQKEILLECDIEYADFFERAFILGYNSTNTKFGYNLETGGHKNKHHSEESKKKMSESRSGKNHPFYGKKRLEFSMLGKQHSDASREKMRNVKLGIKRPDLSKLMTGRKRPEFSKLMKGKFSGENNPMYGSHRTGKDNPFYGKRHSEESKKLMGGIRKPINMYNRNGIFIKSFESGALASKELNIDVSVISRVLRGKYKYTGQYIFKYKENTNDKI